MLHISSNLTFLWSVSIIMFFFRNTKVTVFGTSNFFVDIELRKCTKYQIFKIVVKID